MRLLAAALLIACTPALAQQRTLGIDVQSAKDGDFAKAFGLAQAAGARAVSLQVNWNTLEPRPNNFDAKPDLLAIANSFYPNHDVSVELALRPLDTSGPQLPSDLKGKPLDDPLVIKRFLRLIDVVLARTAKLRLPFLAIGNEVDLGLGDSAKAWAQWTRFFEATRRYVKKKRPKLAVGTIATLNGLTGKHRERLLRLNRTSDLILVSHYGVDPSLQVKPVAAFDEDLAALLKVYLRRPVRFTELGCPSSPVLGGSEAHQAAFLRQMFKTWDKHQDRVPSIMVSWLTDASPQAVKNWTFYYGSDDRRFCAFLASIGVRTYEGKDKQAYQLLKREAKKRGLVR